MALQKLGSISKKNKPEVVVKKPEEQDSSEEKSGSEDEEESRRRRKERRALRKKKKVAKQKRKEEAAAKSSSSDEEEKESSRKGKLKPKKKIVESDDENTNSRQKLPGLKNALSSRPQILNRTSSSINSLKRSVSSSLAHALETSKISSALSLGLRPLDFTTTTHVDTSSLKERHTLKLKIKSTDDLPEDPFTIHPVVKVHVVDRTTGKYVEKSNSDNAAVAQYENLTTISSLSRSSTKSTPCPFVLPIMTSPTILGSGNQRAPVWEEELFINTPYKNIVTEETVILFELLDFGPRVKNNNYSGGQSSSSNASNATAGPSGFHSIAWGFLKPISEAGSLNTPVSVTEADASLRLQLYQYQAPSWLVEAQAQERGLKPSAGKIPSVFLQYQRHCYQKFPSTLHIGIGVKDSKNSHCGVTHRPTNVFEYEEPTVTLEDLEKAASTATAAAPSSNNKTTKTTCLENAPSQLSRCSRYATESCIVPQRILYQLPTGTNAGCVALEFSPSTGSYLAAACANNETSSGDQFPVRIFDLETGAAICNYIGHSSIVYSVRWSHDEKEVVTASADGTARVWQVTSSSSSSNELCLTHSPPTFVYAAEFHPTEECLVITGAFDGKIRFWDTKNSGSCIGIITETLSSTIAVNCLKVDERSGRIFSGHENGFVNVWKVEEGSDLRVPENYNLVRTIRHEEGQATTTSTSCANAVTSLQLHPRKNHLLVQSKGDSLRQYELRSYLLIHKGYQGIECDNDLIKSCYSPDGRYIVSGSEDGHACLFASHYSQRLRGGPWGPVYGGAFGSSKNDGCALYDCSWSPTAHLVALCAYGDNHPILVLCAERGDESIAEPVEHVVTAKSRAEKQARDEKRKKNAERRRLRKAQSSAAAESDVPS